MNTNSEAMRASLLDARYPDADAAFAAIEAAGLPKAEFKASADQGEYLLIDIRPKAEGKPEGAPKAKGKAKGKGKAKAAPAAKPAPAPAKAQGSGRPKAAREAAKAAKAAKGEGAKAIQSKWRPLADRKWIGIWAEYAAKAEKGQLPDVGGAKQDALSQRQAKFYGFNSAGMPYFSADTHKSWGKMLLSLCNLIRAKDLKGLKAFEVPEKSSTRDAIAKMRDLAIGALMAKESKANGKANGKAKADPAPEAAPAAPQE